MLQLLKSKKNLFLLLYSGNKSEPNNQHLKDLSAVEEKNRLLTVLFVSQTGYSGTILKMSGVSAAVENNIVIYQLVMQHTLKNV